MSCSQQAVERLLSGECWPVVLSGSTTPASFPQFPKSSSEPHPLTPGYGTTSYSIPASTLAPTPVLHMQPEQGQVPTHKRVHAHTHTCTTCKPLVAPVTFCHTPEWFPLYPQHSDRTGLLLLLTHAKLPHLSTCTGPFLPLGNAEHTFWIFLRKPQHQNFSPVA